jgi:hypothetical protein
MPAWYESVKVWVHDLFHSKDYDHALTLLLYCPYLCVDVIHFCGSMWSLWVEASLSHQFIDPPPPLEIQEMAWDRERHFAGLITIIIIKTYVSYSVHMTHFLNNIHRIRSLEYSIISVSTLTCLKNIHHWNLQLPNNVTIIIASVHLPRA